MEVVVTVFIALITFLLGFAIGFYLCACGAAKLIKDDYMKKLDVKDKL